MPEFANPFSGLSADRKVTPEELIRAIRYMIAAEYEAVQLYMQLAESTDNTLAQEVLKDIADEERVHAGEFMRLLIELAPDEATLYAEGNQEVQEIIDRLAGQVEASGMPAAAGNPEPGSSDSAVKEMPEGEESSPKTPPPGVGNIFGK
ncbi:MAG: ferritin family protein [Pedobacter sp.]